MTPYALCLLILVSALIMVSAAIVWVQRRRRREKRIRENIRECVIEKRK